MKKLFFAFLLGVSGLLAQCRLDYSLNRPGDASRPFDNRKVGCVQWTLKHTSETGSVRVETATNPKGTWTLLGSPVDAGTGSFSFSGTPNFIRVVRASGSGTARGALVGSPVESPTSGLAGNSDGPVTIGGTVVPYGKTIDSDDILSGAGNFAINGLTGWTVSPLEEAAAWSIADGKLVHISTGTPSKLVSGPVSVVQDDSYTIYSQVASTSGGQAELYLGPDCAHVCNNNFYPGVNAYTDNATATEQTVVEILDRDGSTSFTLTAAAVYHSMPVIGTRATSNANNSLGMGGLAHSTGGMNFSLGPSLLFNTTGFGNVGLGSTLHSNTTGNRNTSVGYDSLVTNQTGNYNVAIGNSVMDHLISGHRNIAIGRKALSALSAGNNNVAFGEWACINLQGSSNVCLGDFAGPSGTFNNTISIGSSAVPVASNTAVIGGGQITDTYFGSPNGVSKAHASGFQERSAVVRPTCEESKRGLFWIEKGTGTAGADVPLVCIQTSAAGPAYGWAILSYTPAP